MDHKLNQYLDSTFLTLMDDDAKESHAVNELCKDALQHNMRAVCVRPSWVKLCKTHLGNNVKVATVIGFPNQKVTKAQELQCSTIGVSSAVDKVKEIEQAIANGCDELDIVLNTSFYKIENIDERNTAIQSELVALRKASGGCPIKLIFEADLLPENYLETLVKLYADCKIDVIKNATGYVKDGDGASPELVTEISRLIEINDYSLKIKASGGILNSSQANRLIDLGASILGTSNAVAILLEQPIRSHTY